MTKEELIRNLKYTMEKHKNDKVDTFGTNISLMCKDILDYLEQQPCEDCVSRTEAIEWIENLRQMDKCFGNYEDDYFPLSEVIDRLKNVPPVTPTQRWIPVSEELPKKNMPCLVSVGSLNLTQIAIYSDLMHTIDHKIFYQGDYGHDSFMDITKYVKAWMPLPKPYEEKRGSEDGSN